MRKLVKLPSFSNVVAGSTATLGCPVGLTYDLISVTYTGITLEQMENIKIVVNGKVIQEYKSGQELDYINRYYGRGAAAGILNLWFLRPELATVRARRLTALGTADVSTLSVQMDVAAAAAAPVLTAHAVQSAPAPMGIVTKIKAFPRSFATTGLQEIDNIPRSGARIAAIHLFKSDVSAVEVAVNSATAWDLSKALGAEIQTRHGRTPIAAACTHVDWCLDGDPGHALETESVQDLRVKPTIDTVGEVRTVVEYLDGYAGI